MQNDSGQNPADQNQGGTQPSQGNPPQPPQPPQGTPPTGAPPAGTPGGQQPFSGGFPPTPPQPPKEEDKTPANYIIGQHLPPVINVTIPAHSLQIDDQKFLHLLAGSISLSKDEKVRIIEALPKLRQEQVDELVRIFEEEKRKFAELSQKHIEQLKKLEKQHWADWQDIELGQKANERQTEDTAKADEIRKQLGL